MSNRTSLCGRALVGAFAAGVLMMSSAGAAVTKGPVTDEIGVLVVPKGAPIVLGGYWVMSGADSALGIDEKRGGEIPIKDHSGQLLRNHIHIMWRRIGRHT